MNPIIAFLSSSFATGYLLEKLRDRGGWRLGSEGWLSLSDDISYPIGS